MPRLTISLLNNIQNFNLLVAIQVHQDYFLEIDMNTLGMKTLVIKKYGAVLFESSAIQLKLFLETKIKLFE